MRPFVKRRFDRSVFRKPRRICLFLTDVARRKDGHGILHAVLNEFQSSERVFHADVERQSRLDPVADGVGERRIDHADHRGGADKAGAKKRPFRRFQ